MNTVISCVRFKQPADVPLETIAAMIASTPVDAYIAHYEATRGITR